jgi:hypothetical protein
LAVLNRAALAGRAANMVLMSSWSLSVLLSAAWGSVCGQKFREGYSEHLYMRERLFALNSSGKGVDRKERGKERGRKS